jgi:membrane protease YdiL (CAAX protease family)
MTTPLGSLLPVPSCSTDLGSRLRRHFDRDRLLAYAVAGAVAASAIAHPLRWPVLVALGIGVSAAASRGQRDAPVVWLAAALLPVQARLVYETVAPSISPTLEQCEDPVSPLALARVVEAAIVLGTLGASIALLGRRSIPALSLRVPSRRIVVLSIVGPLVAVPVALIVGPKLTGPFFGRIDIDLSRPLAILPAAILAIANATMEEAVFRGAVQGWGARSFGANGAIALQAVLFGVTHIGPDFQNGFVMLPVLGAVTVGGLVAGVIVRRTGSLALPIAVHAALDVPLYYAFACRLPAG